MNHLYAQEKEYLPYIVTNNDTIFHAWLPEVLVIGKKRSQHWYYRQQKRLTRLEYNVRKVYPYARAAATKIQEIENKIARISSENERKALLKEEYSQLMTTFKAPLMKLSITQGRILIRLIYRETQHTSFSHIQTYRGSVNAYFWQSIARIFGHNLKAVYDPQGEDAEIEAIVQKIIHKTQ